MLTVSRLTREGVFTDVSLTVRAGEIVALAGLVGSGRSEVARAVFGIDRWTSARSGERQEAAATGSPPRAMAAGVALVPEDRRQQGLVMDMGIDRNVALASLARLGRYGLIRRGSERELASDLGGAAPVEVRPDEEPGRHAVGRQPAEGGARQVAGPRALPADHRRADPRASMSAPRPRCTASSRLVADGMAVLMISSELPEVLGVSDRVIVLHEGRITAELSRAEADEDSIMARRHRHEAVRHDRTAHRAGGRAPGGPVTPGAERVFRVRESGILVVLVASSPSPRWCVTASSTSPTSSSCWSTRPPSRCSRWARRWW